MRVLSMQGIVREDHRDAARFERVLSILQRATESTDYEFEDDDLERMKQRVAARQEGSPLTY